MLNGLKGEYFITAMLIIFQVRTNKLYIYRYGGTKTILGPAHALSRVGRKNFPIAILFWVSLPYLEFPWGNDKDPDNKLTSSLLADGTCLLAVTMC